MALYKEKETRFGIKAGYWRVDSMVINKQRKEASFVLNLYLNKDSEEFIESLPIVDFIIDKDKTKFEEYFGLGTEYTNVYNACYMYCKENVDYFKDAEDV